MMKSLIKIDKYGFYIFGRRFANKKYDKKFEEKNYGGYERRGSFLNFGIWKRK